VQAYRLFEWKKPARLVEIPTPEAGPGEVLVRVGGNGICQSDLHLMHDWEAAPPHLDVRLPMTIGHEIGGWIEACGPGVEGLEKDQPCVVTISGCGRCRFCAEGWNNYCANLGRQPGMGLDGGLADYVVAPAGGIVPLNRLEPWRAAPLTDAGLSAMHAIDRARDRLGPGRKVAVIGVGGLGHMAVMILKETLPVEVIAIDRDPAALELARELGADHLVAADDRADQAIREAAGGRAVDVVLDFVGAGATIALAAAVIGPLSKIVIIGRGSGSFALCDRALPYGAEIITTFGGCRRELMELIALAEAGRLNPRLTPYPLSRVEDAFQALAAGELTGRAVIIPDDRLPTSTAPTATQERRP
jgi:propanol-preferring alcohol dehydrogenase